MQVIFVSKGTRICTGHTRNRHYKRPYNKSIRVCIHTNDEYIMYVKNINNDVNIPSKSSGS